jgi:SAM-dependent methyltransferase
MDPKTLKYYEENKTFIKKTTQQLSFNEIQDTFLNYLDKDAQILDFGCGAGRDTKYFLDRGFKTFAIDGSKAMCDLASKYCKIEVKNIFFEDFEEIEKFDGVWACASLLHTPYKSLSKLFLKIHTALKNNGILYASFKLGDREGYYNNRYYTDLTEKKFLELPNINNYFEILKIFKTIDIRANQENQKWLNLILKKSNL